MFEEIEKARKKLEEDRARQKKEDERRKQEQEAKAIAAYKGKLTECDICAEDRPPTRMASCNAKEKHTYCFTCVKTHIETIIGGGKHTATCMAVDCKGHYPRKVLEEVLDKALITRMDRLKQNDDLKGIKGIEECPFCNFKAFCEDKSRFNCQNPECEMSSCLKCKAEIHPGLSCTEYSKQKKENKGELKGLKLRHLVEEAMTNALLRHCPQCKTPFTKDYGCNKMICPTCGMMSCYVCGAPRITFNHFGAGGCPQFDATEARHDAEVKKAEAEAIAKVKHENPGVTDDDLKIAMSAKVKQDDKRRLDKDHRALRGEAWHFGMPIEGDDEDAEVGAVADQIRNRLRLGREGGRFGGFGEDFVPGEDVHRFLLTRDGGSRDGFGRAPDMPFGALDRDADFMPRRRRRRRLSAGFDVQPTRDEVMREQEAMFNGRVFIPPPQLHPFPHGLNPRGRPGADPLMDAALASTNTALAQAARIAQERREAREDARRFERRHF